MTDWKSSSCLCSLPQTDSASFSQRHISGTCKLRRQTTLSMISPPRTTSDCPRSPIASKRHYLDMIGPSNISVLSLSMGHIGARSASASGWSLGCTAPHEEDIYHEYRRSGQRGA